MDRKLIKAHKLLRRKTGAKSKAASDVDKRQTNAQREEGPSPSLPSRERIEKVLR